MLRTGSALQRWLALNTVLHHATHPHHAPTCPYLHPHPTPQRPRVSLLRAPVPRRLWTGTVDIVPVLFLLQRQSVTLGTRLPPAATGWCSLCRPVVNIRVSGGTVQHGHVHACASQQVRSAAQPGSPNRCVQRRGGAWPAATRLGRAAITSCPHRAGTSTQSARHSTAQTARAVPIMRADG